MNPGNGIETPDFSTGRTDRGTFTLMNPGNGIETITRDGEEFEINDFHINESRQRDWNGKVELRDIKSRNFHINESRQRDWNPYIPAAQSLAHQAFTLMNPGNGIETSQTFPQ